MISRGYVDILISVLGFKNLRSQSMTVIFLGAEWAQLLQLLSGGRAGQVSWPSVVLAQALGQLIISPFAFAVSGEPLRCRPGRDPLGSPGSLKGFPMRKNGVLPMEGTRAESLGIPVLDDLTLTACNLLNTTGGSNPVVV